MPLTIEDFETDFSFKLPFVTYPFQFVTNKHKNNTSLVGHLEYNEKHYANVEIVNGEVLVYNSNAGIMLNGKIEIERFAKVTPANPL